MKHSYSFRKLFPAFVMIIYFGIGESTTYAQVELNTKESNRAQPIESNFAIPADNVRPVDQRQEGQTLTGFDKELNLKANLLLNELRNLLQDAEKEMVFRESVGPGIIEKSNVLCPSVELKNLLLGDDDSKSILIHDRTELKTFVNLITEAINFLEN